MNLLYNGVMKLLAIESNRVRFDGGSMYGHVPKNLWSKWSPADDQNRIPLVCRTLFLQTDEGRNILFDVGAGDFFDDHFRSRYGVEGSFELPNALQKMKISEKEIDSIVLSHLHFDHAGGLLTPHGELRFSNAKYYVSRAHWNQLHQPHRREQASFIPTLAPLLENSGRLELVDTTTHPELDFGLSFTFSHGHTIGLMLSTLELPSGPLVYASDLIPGTSWVHLPITTGYDRFAELVVDEKKTLLDQLVPKKGRIIFTHDPHHPCARITQDSQGKFHYQPSLLEL